MQNEKSQETFLGPWIGIWLSYDFYSVADRPGESNTASRRRGRREGKRGKMAPFLLPSHSPLPCASLVNIIGTGETRRWERKIAFLTWVNFHARSRFARSTIPEEKWGLLVVYGRDGFERVKDSCKIMLSVELWHLYTYNNKRKMLGKRQISSTLPRNKLRSISKY